MLRFSFLLICIQLVLHPLSGQILPSIQKGTQWEKYYDRVPVSGEIRVGALASDSDEKIIPTKFFVRVPEHKESTLCVEISSRDGKYEAKLPYKIKGLKHGIYEFSLPTRHIQELKKYSMREIVILTRIAETCESDEGFYVLSAWNRPELETDRLFIYLNSEKPTFLRYRDKLTGENQNIECLKIETQNSISYNCKCEVPNKGLDGLNEFYIRQRVRTGGTISYNIYPFPFKL